MHAAGPETKTKLQPLQYAEHAVFLIDTRSWLHARIDMNER